MDKHKYCRETLLKLREEVGTSVYDDEVKWINRQRLDSSGINREKRKSISWAVCKRHYQKQCGKCAWCGKDMPMIRGLIEADHINPNAENFNDDSNIQTLHKQCNRQKNAMSIADQAKHLGTTYREILEPEI